MELQVTKGEAQTVVSFSGRLDTLASQEIAPQLDEVQKLSSGTIVLDCKELSYISSSGLRLFLTLRKAAAAQGGKVIVRSINPDIRNVFMMTGFLSLFTIED